MIDVRVLDYYSTWPIIATLAALSLLAATPLFRAADSPQRTTVKRVVTLDGLRGYLALSVVIHHVAVYRVYLTTGVWAAPNQIIFDGLGSVSVAAFFIITSYLFWGQLLRKGGRPAWTHLYVSRLLRIAPLYLGATLTVIAIVFLQTRLQLQVPPRELARELAVWLSLGVRQGRSLNGVDNAWILLAGVTWTLKFEWGFYASLPFLSPLARFSRYGLWVLVASIFAYEACRPLVPRAYGGHLAYLDFFLFGMLIAYLEHAGKSVRLTGWKASCLQIGLILTAFLARSPLLAHVAIGCFLYLVVCGANLFGVLEKRASIRLGDISYGIYLLQGLVLASIYDFVPTRRLALTTPAGHWAICLICMVLVAILALAAHVAIERPGITLGKTIASGIH